MSMTRNQSHDDASTRKRIKPCDKVVSHWPGLNNDALFLVMMKLGGIDFVAFSGVCKSWRSFALSNRHKFITRTQNNDDVLSLVMMRLGFLDFRAFSEVCKSWRSVTVSNRKRFITSRPPMLTCFPAYKRKQCHLMDFDQRKFKTIIPHSTRSKCVGLTCGYLIWVGKETNQFWLVNPITRHQLHFPCVPVDACLSPASRIRSILVFSPAISGWVFVTTERLSDKIWCSIEGKGVWNHVSTTSRILDLHAFKGKIYTLNIDYDTGDVRHLCELRLGLEPKLTLFETKNFPENSEFLPKFVSLDENLHLFEYISGGSYKVHLLDFGEMKWVYCEKTKKEYAFYCSNVNDSINAFKRGPCAATDKSGVDRPINSAYMWYFPHDCLNVNLSEES